MKASLTPRTPLTSARKLFPRSPTSDCESDNSLGHMSPLSSPDRYSSPPCTPERSCSSLKDGANFSHQTPLRTSPRNSRFESFRLSSQASSLTLHFVHRDIKRLRKHVDLNNTSELDKNFPKALDIENEKTPSKLSSSKDIPQMPSQKSFGRHIIEESPNTPSGDKSTVARTADTGENSKVVSVNSDVELSIPANKFYSKPTLTRELFPVPKSSAGNISTRQGSLGARIKTYESYRSVNSRRSTRSISRRARRKAGEINAGVYHKLRRPRPKKLSPGAAAGHKVPKVMPRSRVESMLRSAGLALDLVSLGAAGAGDQTPQKQQDGRGLKRKLPDPPTPPPDPSKKFFKTNRTVHKTKTITVEGNIKIQVAEGKFSLNKPESVFKKRALKVLKFKPQSIRSHPLFEPADDDRMEQVNSSVRKLLEDLGDEPGPDHQVVDGPVVIASVPAEGARAHSDGSGMEASEVVPQTPEKSQVVAEFLVGAGGEVSSPGLSFITSSLAISEENLLPGGVEEPSVASPGVASAGTAVETCTGPSGSEVQDIDDVTNLDAVSFENNLTNSSGKENSTEKYFPLFYNSPEGRKKALSDMTNKKSPKTGKKLPWRFSKEDQYQIDAGQKRLGAARCSECGLVYCGGDMQDELAHLNYHNSTAALKFMGWKQERVAAVHGSGRIVVVYPGDPKSWWNKVADVVQVVDKDLGFADGGSGLDIQGSKVYLYVEGRSVVGCLVAQPLSAAHRLQVADGLDTCSQESYPVRCGISRLWVVISHRRCGIATRLVNCMRTNFMYGSILGIEDFAFSVPTVSGKEFGTKYTKNQNFLVYM